MRKKVSPDKQRGAANGTSMSSNKASMQQQPQFVNVSYPNNVKMVVTSSAPNSQSSQNNIQMVTTSYPQPQFFQTTAVSSNQQQQQQPQQQTVHFDPISLQQLGWSTVSQFPPEVSSLFIQPSQVAQVVTNSQNFQSNQQGSLVQLVQTSGQQGGQQAQQTMLVVNANGQALLQPTHATIGHPTNMSMATPIGKKAPTRTTTRKAPPGVQLRQQGNTLVVAQRPSQINEHMINQIDTKPPPPKRVRIRNKPSAQQTQQQQIIVQQSQSIDHDIQLGDTVDAVVEGVAHGYMGDDRNQVLPSAVQHSTPALVTHVSTSNAIDVGGSGGSSVTGRPRTGRTNDTWRLVGVFDSEEDMQRERLSQRVSKRKVNHMKQGYKVTYRCNSWRRLGCHYSMYAIHNKEDGRISLHERGAHIHALVPAPRKSILSQATQVCHFGAVTGQQVQHHNNQHSQIMNHINDEIDILGDHDMHEQMQMAEQQHLQAPAKPKRQRNRLTKAQQQARLQQQQQQDIKPVMDMKPQPAFVINDIQQITPQPHQTHSQQHQVFQLQVQPNGQSAIVQVPQHQQHLMQHGQPVVQHLTGGSQQILISSPQGNQNLQAILQCMTQNPAQIVVSSQQ